MTTLKMKAWQPVDARTQEPLHKSVLSKAYAETIAERHKKKGIAAVVIERVAD